MSQLDRAQPDSSLPMQRPIAHEIDTLAMRQIPLMLPPAWVARTVQSDYGVDIEVEPFAHGRSLGDLLLIQVKGTTAELDEDAQDWSFSMPVKGMLYAELFMVPVLLAVRPVEQSIESGFRFVWLQEYIDVRLDVENPSWRNQTTSTIYLPRHNTFRPGADTGGILEIARRPKRTKQLGTLTYLAHEYARAQELYSIGRSSENVVQMRKIIEEAYALDTLFGPQGWAWSNTLAKMGMAGARYILSVLGDDGRVDPSKIPGYYLDPNIASELEDDAEFLYWSAVHGNLHSGGQIMASIAAGANSIDARRFAYHVHGRHDF